MGGKAASLGTMLQAGFPVPDGFAVTTGAFRETLGRDVAGRISRDLAALDTDDVTALEAAAARLRAPRGDHAAPGGRRGRDPRRLRGRCGDDVPVAVRSSATAEDGAEDSFAGQQDTYLWVVGADAVLDARPPLLGAACSRRARSPTAWTAGSRTTTSRWASPSSGWCRRAPRAWR